MEDQKIGGRLEQRPARRPMGGQGGQHNARAPARPPSAAAVKANLRIVELLPWRKITGAPSRNPWHFTPVEEMRQSQTL